MSLFLYVYRRILTHACPSSPQLFLHFSLNRIILVRFHFTPAVWMVLLISDKETGTTCRKHSVYTLLHTLQVLITSVKGLKCRLNGKYTARCDDEMS